MKKKRIFGLAGLAAVVLAAGAGIYYTTSQHDSKGNGDLKVVTSFYPVYEFTKQVVGDEGRCLILSLQVVRSMIFSLLLRMLLILRRLTLLST